MIYLEDFYIQRKYYQLDFTTHSISSYSNSEESIIDIVGYYSVEKCSGLFASKRNEIAYFKVRNNYYLLLNNHIVNTEKDNLEIKQKRRFLAKKYLIKTDTIKYECTLSIGAKLDNWESNIHDVIFDLYNNNWQNSEK